MKLKKNIFLVGKVHGWYRSQNLIKFLIDNHYSVYYNSQRNMAYLGSTRVKRILRLFLRVFEEIFNFFLESYNIIISDVVIVLAINNEHQRSLFLAHFFKKKNYL